MLLCAIAGVLGGFAWLAGAGEGPSTIGPEALSAGSYTVARFDRGAYGEPAPILDHRQRDAFERGRKAFHRRWVVFGSPNGDWGLGPTYIADRCSGCHENAGRGMPPEDPRAQLQSMLVRISVPGADGVPGPHPHYGDQIQNRALEGLGLDDSTGGVPVPPEADVRIAWEPVAVGFADGSRVELRRPRVRIDNLRFGPLGEGVQVSMRNTAPVFGLGLLEAVPETALLELAARQRRAGLNGRLNRVRDDATGTVAPGRFGWKANQPTLRQQTAGAALGDMGVTSTLYPLQNCPPAQTICAAEVPGGTIELIDQDLDDIEVWLRGLGVPARRHTDDPRFRTGERLFAAAGCDGCHVPWLETAAEFPAFPPLAGQKLRPYTDLLLHDMGESLADGRPDGLAGGRDWRTPPLWALGLSRTVSGSGALLHDGRARDVTEAILWHGGEAQAAREAFRAMPARDRAALLFFLDSI